MSAPRKDLTGKTFNRLTAISVHSSGRNGLNWNCKCACGNIRVVTSTRLTSGNAKSCGCYRAPKIGMPSGHKDKKWKGEGDISGECWYDIQHSSNKRASKREVSFEISIKYAWKLFLSQGGKCAISGVPIHFKHEDGKLVHPEKTASLDRIDHRKGYLEGNVQWVHKQVNIMKNILSDADLVSWCKTIAAYQAEKEKESGVQEPSKTP